MQDSNIIIGSKNSENAIVKPLFSGSGGCDLHLYFIEGWNHKLITRLDLSSETECFRSQSQNFDLKIKSSQKINEKEDQILEYDMEARSTSLSDKSRYTVDANQRHSRGSNTNARLMLSDISLNNKNKGSSTRSRIGLKLNKQKRIRKTTKRHITRISSTEIILICNKNSNKSSN